MSEMGLASRVTPVQTAMSNCTRDGGWFSEVGKQLPISSRCKRLRLMRSSGAEGGSAVHLAARGPLPHLRGGG